MKVALISDLHSSPIQLDAVLAELDRDGVDQIVCLGDVVDLGPRPREVIARLRRRNIPCLLGNHDALDGELLEPRDVNAWCKDLLDEEDRSFLRALPRSIAIALPSGGRLLCVHGSPASFDDQLLSTTPEPLLDTWLDGQDFAVLAAGHTHIQMLRRHHDKILLNAGSVGMPFLDPFDPEHPRPPSIHRWAEYAVLTDDGNGPNIELRRARYDFDAYARDVRASGLPKPEAWLDTWR